MQLPSKKLILITTTAIFATISFSNAAIAVEAINGTTYTPADDLSTGLELGGAELDTVEVTVENSSNSIINIGSNSADSIRNNDFDSSTLIVNTTQALGGSTNDNIIFRSDIVEQTGDVVLNINNGSIEFQGEVGDNTKNIEVNVGNATPTTSNLVFSHFYNEDRIINADIKAISEANTVNIEIDNSGNDAREISVLGQLGENANRLDTLTIGNEFDDVTNNIEFANSIYVDNINIGVAGGDPETHNISFTGAGKVVDGDTVGLDDDIVNFNLDLDDANESFYFYGAVSNVDLFKIASSGNAVFYDEITNSAFEIDASDSGLLFQGVEAIDSDINLTSNAVDAEITIRGNGANYSGTITAESGSNVDLILYDSVTFSGSATFSDGNDSVQSILGQNIITGDIDFGAGSDTFSMEDSTITLTGELSNLETMEFFDGSGLYINEGGSTSGLIYGNSGAEVVFGYDGLGGTFNLLNDIDQVNVTVSNGATLNTNNSNLGSDYGLNNLNITGGTLNAEDDIFISGNQLYINNSGTLHINSGVTVSTPMITTADSGTLIIDVASPSSAGFLNVTDGAVNLENLTLEANVTGSDSLFTDGNQIKVAGGTSALIGTDGNEGQSALAITENSAMFSINALDGSKLGTPLSGNDLYFVFDRDATIEQTASSSNNKKAGAILDGLSGTSNPELSQIITNVNSASQSQLDQIIESITPTVDSGGAVGSQNFVNNTLDITSKQIDITTNGETGVSSGNQPTETGLRSWGQVFGQASNQDRRNGIAGYDANTFGFAVGADTEKFSDNLLFGIALSYGVTEVDSDNANRTNTNIDSYQLTAYGNYELKDDYFTKAMLAYAYNNAETTRHNVGGLGIKAEGDFGASIYTGRVDFGRDIQYHNTRITPSAMAHYSHYSGGDYTETGAGGANLSIDETDLDILEFGGTVEAGWEYNLENGQKILPEIRFGYRYDVIGDNLSTNSSFVGGGTKFQTLGADPAQGTVTLGGGLVYQVNKDVDLSTNYEFEAKEDYTNNAGFVRATFKF
jgi:outer membrane autotransporter protein